MRGSVRTSIVGTSVGIVWTATAKKKNPLGHFHAYSAPVFALKCPRQTRGARRGTERFHMIGGRSNGRAKVVAGARYQRYLLDLQCWFRRGGAFIKPAFDVALWAVTP